MKKLMRIALVFALAGATLVGCTKDYSGDISDLNKKVSEQQAAVTALQSAVSNAQTAADNALASAQNALKEAQAAAKAAADANNDEEVAALTERVAAIEDQIAELEAKVKALDGLEAKLNEVAEQLKKDVNAKVDAALEEIRAEVAALIESVGVTDFEILDPADPDVLEIVYGQFNGVFSGLKSATWDGPRAEEVAALEKGSYISSSNVEEFTIQVNPVNADLHDVEFSLQNQDGVAAPLDFGAPYSYEDTKAASGVWYVPFSVGEITQEFVKRESGNNPIWKNAKASMVYSESVRSNYITVKIDQAAQGAYSEFVTYDASIYSPGGAYNTLSQRYLTGEFTFEAKDPQYVYDAFITKCKNTDYQIVKYGIKFDGLTVSYDLDAVNEYFKDDDKEEIVFKFEFKQLNVNGYITELKGNDGVSVTIKKYNPTPKATEHKAEIATVAKHEANPKRTTQTIDNTQSVTIDLAEAAKAWGIEAGSDARTLWDVDFFQNGSPTASIISALYYPSDDSTVNFNVNDSRTQEGNILITNVTFNEVGGTNHNWNGTATLEFSENYKKFVNLGEDIDNDPIGKTFYVTFKLEDSEHKDAYIVTVPVQVTAPTAESIASWYKWDDITVYQTTATKKDINLNTYLAANTNAGYDKTQHGFGVAFNTKKVKVNNVDEIWAETQVVGTGDLKETQITAFVGEESKINFVGKADGLPSHYIVTTGWDEGTKFTFKGNATTSYEVENLYITAIGGRKYPIENAKVNFVVREGNTSMTLSKDLVLGSAPSAFEVLTNSEFEPFNSVDSYYGSFTLADNNGKTLFIENPTRSYGLAGTYYAISKVETFEQSGNGFSTTPTASNLIDVADQAYECNLGTETSADIQDVYGLKVSPAKDLNDYYGKKIQVKVTFHGNTGSIGSALSYVATKAPYTGDQTFTFVVTIK